MLPLLGMGRPCCCLFGYLEDFDSVFQPLSHSKKKNGPGYLFVCKQTITLKNTNTAAPTKEHAATKAKPFVTWKQHNQTTISQSSINQSIKDPPKHSMLCFPGRKSQQWVLSEQRAERQMHGRHGVQSQMYHWIGRLMDVVFLFSTTSLCFSWKVPKSWQGF